ncbi:MAG: Holliday junction resolvase-like protein [Thermoplasmatota archaeon]
MASAARKYNVKLTARDALVALVAALALAFAFYAQFAPASLVGIALVALVVLVYVGERREKNQALVSEGRTSQKGAVIEQFIPLMRDWPWPKETFIHVGGPHPFDGIQITPDRVIFIEIKSGGAGMRGIDGRERHVRELVAAKAVEWRLVRLNENGLSVVDVDGNPVSA